MIFCALGSPLAVYGLYLVIAGSVSSGNLSGLLVIFGLPMLAIGVVALCGLVPSFRFMKRNLEGDDRLTAKDIKTLTLSVVIPSLLVIFLLVQQRLGRMTYNKLAQDSDIYYPTPKMIQSMKQRITNEFRKHETLFLTVRYFPPQSGELADQESFKNYYLEAIGRENIRKFRWGAENNWFVVEVTEVGYENLRKSQYLRSIYFYDIATYGKI